MNPAGNQKPKDESYLKTKKIIAERQTPETLPKEEFKVSQ